MNLTSNIYCVSIQKCVNLAIVTIEYLLGIKSMPMCTFKSKPERIFYEYTKVYMYNK